MIIRLRPNGKLQKKLSSLPITGIGATVVAYHIIDAYLKDGRVIKRLKVFNFEIIELPNSVRCLKEYDISDIKLSE